MEEISLVVLADPADPHMQRLDEIGSGVKITMSKNPDDLTPALADARVLLNWTGFRTEVKSVTDRAPKLEWIHSKFAGVDHLLFPELIESPIPLTNSRGVFSSALGEYVMGGILYWAKDFPRMLRSKKERRWDVFPPLEIARQTIGIIGFGDIGRTIASRAKNFGMQVFGMRRDPAKRPGDEFVDRMFTPAQLHEMLPLCDYVVVAAPLTPETRHMMGAAEFALMSPDSIIINVGRGPVIDEAAMTAALLDQRIRGAFLDVFEVEPLPPTSALWDLDNVFFSAHCADQTKDWLHNAMTRFLHFFEQWRRGEPLTELVDKRAGY